jgi:hypothetical protein
MNEANGECRHVAILTRVPASAARQIHELAEADDRSIAALTRRWILQGLERAQERPQEQVPAGA